MTTAVSPSAVPSILPVGQGSWFATAPMPPVTQGDAYGEWPPPPETASTAVLTLDEVDEVPDNPVEPPKPAYERMSRDAWALGVAKAIAEIADCSRSQVGSLILNTKHRFIGVGYNGLPPGVPGCATAGNCPRGQLTQGECPPNSDYYNCASTHAERNAIEDALARPGGAEALKTACLYVTREPCPACWTLIHSVGIHRVVTPTAKYRRDLEPK